MGLYLEKLSTGERLRSLHRADQLIADGATEVKYPQTYDPHLVCVVQNGPFDAAGWAYSKREMQVFARLDGRPRRWLMCTDDQLRMNFLATTLADAGITGGIYE